LLPPSPFQKKHGAPVPFQGEVCSEFAAEVRVIIHVIKRAIDDYSYGKNTKIKDPKKRRLLTNRAREAKRFIDSSKGMAYLLKIIGFGNSINLVAIRKLIEKQEHQRHNWHSRT
jgi:hypothetical protein